MCIRDRVRILSGKYIKISCFNYAGKRSSGPSPNLYGGCIIAVSYTHLRAHET
nr:hypothetical protein [Elizabethkingia sp. ASV34]